MSNITWQHQTTCVCSRNIVYCPSSIHIPILFSCISWHQFLQEVPSSASSQHIIYTSSFASSCLVVRELSITIWSLHHVYVGNIIEKKSKFSRIIFVQKRKQFCLVLFLGIRNVPDTVEGYKWGLILSSWRNGWGQIASWHWETEPWVGTHHSYIASWNIYRL